MTITRLALGQAHACALLSDQSVRCWGANQAAQLAQAVTTPSSPKPVAVASLAGAQDIALGGDLGCILRAGKVLCWGDNTRGQAGPKAQGTPQKTPVEVTLPAKAKRVSLGELHACALLDDDRVFCWGDNTLGQLGVISPADQSAQPVEVVGLGQPTSLWLGGKRSCAILTDQSVRCWGDDPQEEAHQSLPAPTPQKLDKLGAAEALTIGKFHICARSSLGSLRCRGANVSGQLGNGDFAPSEAAALVVDGQGKIIVDASAASAGDRHQCLIRSSSSTAQCWGANDVQQLGKAGPSSAQALSVPGVFNVTAIASGGRFSCAVAQDAQSVQCWGANDQGQLGRGQDSTFGGPQAVLW